LQDFSDLIQNLNLGQIVAGVGLGGGASDADTAAFLQRVGARLDIASEDGNPGFTDFSENEAAVVVVLGELSENHDRIHLILLGLLVLAGNQVELNHGQLYAQDIIGLNLFTVFHQFGKSGCL